MFLVTSPQAAKQTYIFCNKIVKYRQILAYQKNRQKNYLALNLSKKKKKELLSLLNKKFN